MTNIWVTERSEHLQAVHAIRLLWFARWPRVLYDGLCASVYWCLVTHFQFSYLFQKAYNPASSVMAIVLVIRYVYDRPLDACTEQHTIHMSLVRKVRGIASRAYWITLIHRAPIYKATRYDHIVIHTRIRLGPYMYFESSRFCCKIDTVAQLWPHCAQCFSRIQI